LRNKSVFGEDQPFEIIFAKDGSKDGSAEVMRALRERFPPISILTHYRNPGKSHQVSSGFTTIFLCGSATCGKASGASKVLKIFISYSRAI
jgi:hypothetical protein